MRGRLSRDAQIARLTEATNRIAEELEIQRGILDMLRNRLDTDAPGSLPAQTARIGEQLDSVAALTTRISESVEAAAANSAVSARFATRADRQGLPIRAGFLVHNYEARRPAIRAGGLHGAPSLPRL